MTIADDRVVTLQHPDRLYIGGEWVAPKRSSMFDVVEAATEEPFLSVAEAGADDVARAIGAARTAFDDGPWPRMTHAERATHLRAIGQAVRDRAPDLATIWSCQTGILHAIAEVAQPAAGGIWDGYAAMADSYEWVEHHPSAMGGVGLLVREPVGVVGAIIPWNGPLTTATHKVAPALLAGCTVVLKASPEAPGEAYVLAEIIDAVGLPPGVVNVVVADREASEVLVRDPRVDKITFTGSTAAGRRIGGILGERIGRYTLELGGKSAAVVLDDVDPAALAAALAPAACVITGQVCASLTRIVVPRGAHDDIVEALGAAFAQVTVGDPFDRSTGMGPLAMERQRERVERYIALGQQEGAVLAAGGHRPQDLPRGWFIEPTVFAGVDNSSTIAREEIFGPVVSVIPADSEEQAISIANDSDFGLNAAVFTDDADRAYAIARRLRSGTVGHNGFRIDFDIAFGGFKQSGVGREGGTEGLRHFTEAKTVILAEAPSGDEGGAA